MCIAVIRGTEEEKRRFFDRQRIWALADHPITIEDCSEIVGLWPDAAFFQRW